MKKLSKTKLNRKILKFLNIACIVSMLVLMMSTVVFAEEAAGVDIWAKAKAIMMDVYDKILLISTAAAVVTASIALLLMNFSKSGKTVDESRSWLKRIILTWAILNSLGFIMAYLVPLFSGGKWAG